MAFDLVILLLCSYKLASHRSSTLGNLLLRDGIVSHLLVTFTLKNVLTSLCRAISAQHSPPISFRR